MKAIIIHGNCGGKPSDNWIPYLETELTKLDIQVIAREFPDNDLLDFVHFQPDCLAHLLPDVWPMAKLVDLFKPEGVFNPFLFK